MKRLYNTILIPVSALCLTALAFSCMKEGDDCPADITLRFSYTFNEYDTDLFADQVDEVYSYIFDGSGIFLASVRVEAARLGPSNTYTMQLDEGFYRIVAFGNIDESSYRLDGDAATRASSLSLIPDDNGEVNGTLSDLFYGAAEFSVGSNTSHTIDISMVRNTKNINVLIPSTGGTRTIPDTDYTVRITGSNGAIDFENNTVATPTTYKPNYSKTLHGNLIHDLAQFKTLKLSVDGDTAIELYKNGQPVRQDDLVAILIAEFPQIRTDEDLLRYSDYEFVYELDNDGNFVLASITAGPWSKQLGQQGGI